MGPLIPIAMELAQYVPGIIRLLTGSDKAADVADAVVGVAQAATGTDNGTAALAKLRADPGAVLNFQQAMAQQQADLEKAFLADVQSARTMQIAALGQEDQYSKRFVYHLAAAWSLFAMLYFSAVTFMPLTAPGQRIADTILGVLISSVLGTILAFFYGSTKGSAEKTRLLAQAAPPKG